MGKKAVTKNKNSRTNPKARQLVIRLRPNDLTMTTPDKKPYTFVLKPEHRGKIIAVANGPKKKVIAFGTHYNSVVAKAQRLTNEAVVVSKSKRHIDAFSIMFAPEKGVIYTR